MKRKLRSFIIDINIILLLTIRYLLINIIGISNINVQ